mmetsp:Transcript_12335/g.21188  ORF Transcript_12335/g.21188 Transcript_12335/m.21188 type:complete len:105 (+) Transcript_12335:223-537(+)
MCCAMRKVFLVPCTALRIVYEKKKIAAKQDCTIDCLSNMQKRSGTCKDTLNLDPAKKVNFASAQTAPYLFELVHVLCYITTGTQICCMYTMLWCVATGAGICKS